MFEYYCIWSNDDAELLTRTATALLPCMARIHLLPLHDSQMRPGMPPPGFPHGGFPPPGFPGGPPQQQ